MSSGRIAQQRPEHSVRLAAFLSLMLLLSQAVGAPIRDLDELMLRLGEVHSVAARYTENVKASLLQQGIESTGTIRYIAPDTLIKLSDGAPQQEIRIAGDRISMREAGGLQEVRIGEHSAIAAMVSALRSVFAGDLDDLEQHFRVRFERLGANRANDGWRLSLKPQDADVSWLLSHIEIRGSRREIRRIEILEPNGDSRTMRFELVAIDPPAQ